MLLVDHTCVTPAENLALDELLLDEAEQHGAPREFLRLWEPDRPLVVIGRSSRFEIEVDRAACERRQIPVLRRSSGGAAIVTGPGCLMYAVVLSYETYPHLRSIDQAHRHVMERLVAAIGTLIPGVAFQGTCDLTWQGCKFSGNALRCRREHLLYHGTLLYDMSLDWIAECLRMPPRTPDYRAGRGHRSFVTNLPVQRESLRDAVQRAFPTQGTYADWDRERLQRLIAEKFGSDTWNQQW
ncbi:MAG: lipoate--protein ligase family protein [Planctomycetaceae bacterium]|nr:lipoate--protein ligase family protein [Planctomycetaceae bacterium]